eukprot:jgi/Undpi1/3804/HiC_scaffold_16.g07173.m1
MAGTSGEEGGGGGPSCSSVAIVRGDLTSIDIAAEIKSFAATGYAASSGGDSDDATTSQLSIFHLASVMSGHAENDFDEALRVNVEGTRSMLDICREIGGRPRFVFASSIAAFGGGAEVDDETKLAPEGSGAQHKPDGVLRDRTAYCGMRDTSERRVVNSESLPEAAPFPQRGFRRQNIAIHV